LQIAQEFTQRPRAGVSLGTLSQVLSTAGLAFLCTGDRARAEEVWRQLQELGERTQTPFVILGSLVWEGLHTILGGDLEGALAFSERYVERSDALGSPVLGRQVGGQIARRALLYLGRSEEALARLGEARERAGAEARWSERAVRARLLARAGRLAEA